MIFLRRLAPVATAIFLCLGNDGQTQDPAPAARPVSSAESSQQATAPNSIPLAEVIAQADETEAELIPPLLPEAQGSTAVPGTRDLSRLTQEINDRQVETTKLVQPGALLETLRDLQTNWQSLAELLSEWARELSVRASVLDKRLARAASLRSTWAKTLETAQRQEAPPEIRERIQRVLQAVAEAETRWQKERTAMLAEQGRVAEQSKRVNEALATVRSAQNVAVSRLFVRDSPPIWSPEVWANARRNLAQEGHASLNDQWNQVRIFAGRQWGEFAWLGLIFTGLMVALFWVRRALGRWTDEDATMAQASRVLQAPIAMAAILSLLVCLPLFQQPPRLFWTVVALLGLPPIVILLRRLIDRALVPVLYALCVFYVVAQIRKVAASFPAFSRLLLLAEMVGGTIFLLWFISSTRQDQRVATSHRVARGAARFGVVLFAVIFFADAFGYFRLANYLAAGSLSTAYSAILLYAAALSLAGLVFVALRVHPLASLRVVNRHRALLQHRSARLLYFIAAIVWVFLMLEEFSLRVPLLQRAAAIFNAELNYQSLHLSLGGVLAFAIAIWVAAMLSRFVRFVLEEDIYSRFQVAAGSSYAASTLLHYVILLVGFFIAVAALGVDMTKFTLLAGALGVGIGFGLQNIINNFVSGLILLFERPVKVGDVVQVGDATGVIQRIGIRASVIRIANSSELIVPNSVLISERVTNCTFANRQRLIELPVHIAYGTDPRKVIALLTKVAAAHPLAAQLPTPQTLLTGFGTDALQFNVRLWTNSSDQSPQIQSDVAVAITEALAAANIAVPFPQRDLHLQSIEPAAWKNLRSAPPPQIS